MIALLNFTVLLTLVTNLSNFIQCPVVLKTPNPSMNKIIFVTGERMLRQVHHVFTALSSLYTTKHCFIVVLLSAFMLHRNEWVIYNFSYWIYFLIEVCVWSVRGCTCRRVVFILYWQLNFHGNVNIVRTLYRMSVYMIVQVKTLFLIENQQKFWSFIYVLYIWYVITRWSYDVKSF